MRQKQIIIWGSIGFLIGAFIGEPVVFSLYAYDIAGGQGSWLPYLTEAYERIFTWQGIGQVLLAGLLGCFFGIALFLRASVPVIIYNKGNYSTVKSQIVDLLNRGKSEQVVLKSSLRWDMYGFKPNKALEHDAIKTIAAFMNTKGGHLLIGTDEQGLPVGLKEDYSTLKEPGRMGFRQLILELIAQKLGIDFCSLVKVEFGRISHKDVCHLEVSKGPTPVYVHLRDRSHFYIRTSNSIRELNIKEAMDYIETNF